MKGGRLRDEKNNNMWTNGLILCPRFDSIEKILKGIWY